MPEYVQYILEFATALGVVGVGYASKSQTEKLENRLTKLESEAKTGYRSDEEHKREQNKLRAELAKLQTQITLFDDRQQSDRDILNALSKKVDQMNDYLHQVVHKNANTEQTNQTMFELMKRLDEKLSK